MKTLQIISKRVDVDKLDGRYYSRLRTEIKKKVKSKSDMLIINLIPKEPIDEMWVVMTLLDLQKEFTDIITIPNSEVDDAKLREWIEFFEPREVFKM